MNCMFLKFSEHTKNASRTDKVQSKASATPRNLFKVSDRDSKDASLDDRDTEPHELTIQNVEELGNVSSTSTLVKRDLGFQGKLGHHILLTYGDTMFSDAAGSDEFRGMTCNSLAIACESPTEVFDPVIDDNSYPECFIRPSEEYGEDPSVYSLGITNVIETSHGKGILYFLLNHRPDFKDHLLGAGVAEVSIDMNHNLPIPKAQRLGKFWWDGEQEPWYGDVCALRAGDYIYACGHAKDNPWVYLARVKLSYATNIDAYEYWNGKDWQRDRLRREDLNEEQSIFWQVNQGQIVWSKHHRCFLFVYCDNFWSCQILIKTALAPEGPWSGPVRVFKPKPVQEGGNVYAAIPHPYFDPSGKTLIVTYTNHPNTIQAIRIIF